MNGEENYIIDFFKVYGLTAEKIPESSDESPDFLIDCGNEKILVELKTKIDSTELLDRRENAFESGEAYERAAVIARDNAISKRIRKAAGQLKAQKNRLGADYCFVFLFANGVYKSEQLGVFETSLYGDKDIIPMGDDFDKGIKKCYYYTNSDFFNNRSVLDGAFILGENFARLCMNSVSGNHRHAIQSQFVETFRPGVLCPKERESRGEAYIIDDPVDRSDEDALNSYLCKKYGLNKIVPFNWPQFTVTSRIDVSK